MAAGSSIGVLETRGMAGLMAATDAMLKDADVAICGRHGIGSGWVTVVIKGAVAAVRSAMQAGREALAGHGEVIRAQVIAGPTASAATGMPHAAANISGSTDQRALGVLETQGLAPLIAGTDAMTKAAAVHLDGWAFIGGALCHACVRGNVAAVQTALMAGRDAAEGVGPVHDELVLAQPDEGLAALLPPASTGAPEAAGCLGVLETTGYVASVAGADAMIKSADVELRRFALGSGGRCVALITGSLDAVEAAVRTAKKVVPLVGELNGARVLSGPDPQVVACFAAQAIPAAPSDRQSAMGLIETRTTVGLVKAMDAMLKAADVEYEGSYKVGYFLTASVIRGGVGAVRAALDVGAKEAARFGELVAVHLIPHPYTQLEQRLAHR